MEERFMKEALELAKYSASLLEIPVGAVIVKDGEIVGRGYNARETGKNALYHAEIRAINDACETLGGWRLFQCDMYVTLEPCPMCAGAIINSRIKNLYFGAPDPKGGCFGGLINFNDFSFNHKPSVTGGIMEGECSALIKDFFKNLRKNNS